MHTVIRQYTGSGADELFAALEANEADVRELIGSVPGFISYAAFRTSEGGATVTVCESQEGTDESTRRAAGWVRDNVDATVDAPQIAEGDAVIHF